MHPTSTHTQSLAIIPVQTPIQDFTMYTNIEEYKKFPQLTLIISNHPVTFLIDFGVTSSVLRKDTLSHPPPP